MQMQVFRFLNKTSLFALRLADFIEPGGVRTAFASYYYHDVGTLCEFPRLELTLVRSITDRVVHLGIVPFLLQNRNQFFEFITVKCGLGNNGNRGRQIF